jgi:hypothetical protein
MAWEVERERAKHRLVEGLDTLDFYALLRSFDKVSHHGCEAEHLLIE